MKIAITGHRPDKIYDHIEWITTKLDQIFTALKPELIISGMAVGVDQLAAEIAIANEIPVLAAIPFLGQENRWNERDKINYNALLKQATTVEVLSNTPSDYYEAVKFLHARNKWMVDRADLIVAVWDGSKGGTSNCVNYAKRVQSKRNLPIVRLNPITKEVSRLKSISPPSPTTSN